MDDVNERLRTLGGDFINDVINDIEQDYIDDLHGGDNIVNKSPLVEKVEFHERKDEEESQDRENEEEENQDRENEEEESQDIENEEEENVGGEEEMIMDSVREILDKIFSRVDV
jgi:hypothetical protein